MDLYGIRIMIDKKVSIITPMYNVDKYLSSCIFSVLNQKYKNWELILVDDCSNDNTVYLAEFFVKLDSRIQLVRNNVNSGVAFSRNKAIETSSGDYIAFLDSDDIWLSNKLSSQISVLDNTSFNISHASYFRFNSNGIIKEKKAKKIINLNDMLKENKIGNLTGVYNVNKLGKKYFDNIGHEDYLFWLKLMEENDSIGVLQPIAKYRVLDKSLSSNKIKAVTWHSKIIKMYVKNPVKYWYFMSCYIFNALFSRIFS